MRVWILITAWTLIPFGSLGLLVSLLIFSLLGILVNGLLVILGVLDINSLKRVHTDPLAWRRIAITQSLLGVVIAISMATLGFTIIESNTWRETTTSIKEILGQPYGIDEAFAQSAAIIHWGLVISGALILFSQALIAVKLLKLSKTPPVLQQ